MVSVPAKPDRIKVEGGEVYELPSLDRCDDCGCDLREHVTVPGYRGLIRICNGDLIRLV